MEPGTQMGPVVSDEQFRTVSGYLESGKADGATLAGGGGGGRYGYLERSATSPEHPNSRRLPLTGPRATGKSPAGAAVVTRI